MGKIGGSSWLTAVKKAFRSPSKENDKRTSRRREEHEQDEEEKKRGKRRWIFRKPSNHHETIIQHSEAKNITTITNSTTTTTAINEVKNPISVTTDAEEQQRHAVAVAMATTAAAEAAVATAQAAVEFIRLTRPSIFLREHYAAIVVQTIFRGYLARRALRALKGLVKLQALVRGYNVRKRAKKTLQCMQSLVRVQTRVRDQRRRLSHEGSFDSMLSNPSSLWEDRKSISREGSNVTGEWEDHTVEEIHAMLEKTKETAFIKREKALAYAFSHQMWKSGRESYASEEEPEKPRWTDGQWENTRRTSCDQRVPIRTVEIDTSRPYSYTPNVRRAQYQHHHYQQQIPSSYYASSPLHRAYQNQNVNSPITPPSLKAKPLQMHSASPRCLREDRNYPTAQTPNLGSTYYHGIRGGAGTTAVPNYMAATASAKARVRSHSAPRQRPSTPEREKTGSAKKRLSFPVPDPYSGNEGNGGHLGMERRSNMSSCCTESLGDDISPSSTYDLRRWLR